MRFQSDEYVPTSDGTSDVSRGDDSEWCEEPTDEARPKELWEKNSASAVNVPLMPHHSLRVPALSVCDETT